MKALLSSLGLAAVLLAACGNDDDGKPNADAGARDAEADADASTADASKYVSPMDLIALVRQADYTADQTAVTGVRTPGSEHWQDVQDSVKLRLTDLGYDVQLESFHAAPGAYPEFNDGVNIIATKEGTLKPEEIVLVSAHYDHIAGCEGADDNASGVAALLQVAKALSSANFERTLVIAVWDLEEFGLKGSLDYAAKAKMRGANIRASFVFDTISYTDTAPNSQTLPEGFSLLFPSADTKVKGNQSKADFIAAIGDSKSAEPLAGLVAYAGMVGLKAFDLPVPDLVLNSDILLDLRRSDHAAFWLNDYPSIFLTDTGNFRNPNYHCLNSTHDTVGTTNPEFATKVAKVTVGAAADALGLRE
ncbi:MAG: M28 family peptidase [Polyangiales bacterium]